MPFNQLGAATSDLTLFRQIGTTVGIAAAYTLFRLNFSWQLLREQVIGAGAPAALVPVDAPPCFDIAQLTSPTGGGGGFLAQIPVDAQAIFVEGFHRALTISIANSVWLGVAAAVVALGAAFFLREIPLRTTMAPATAATGDERAASAQASAPASGAAYRSNPAAD